MGTGARDPSSVTTREPGLSSTLFLSLSSPIHEGQEGRQEGHEEGHEGHAQEEVSGRIDRCLMLLRSFRCFEMRGPLAFESAEAL